MRKPNRSKVGTTTVKKGRNFDVADLYQKKKLRDQILLRSNSYIGSTQKYTQNCWVYKDGRMVKRHVSYVPTLCRIFDEIPVNVADHKQTDPSMSALEVNIDIQRNTITVRNNGVGIPVEFHKKKRVYVPEMIFGEYSQAPTSMTM